MSDNLVADAAAVDPAAVQDAPAAPVMPPPEPIQLDANGEPIWPPAGCVLDADGHAVRPGFNKEGFPVKPD